MSDSFRPHGLYPARLLSPWDSLGKNTGVSYHVLLQGIFLIQGSNSHHFPSPALAGGFFTTSAAWEAQVLCKWGLWLLSCLHLFRVSSHFIYQVSWLLNQTMNSLRAEIWHTPLLSPWLPPTMPNSLRGTQWMLISIFPSDLRTQTTEHCYWPWAPQKPW